MRLRQSFWAMVGRNADVAPESLVEEVRHVMLAQLDLYCGSDTIRLDYRISCAADIVTLWYLRSDLMGAIAATQGESFAKDRIVEVTDLFEGFRPGGK